MEITARGARRSRGATSTVVALAASLLVAVAPSAVARSEELPSRPPLHDETGRRTDASSEASWRDAPRSSTATVVVEAATASQARAAVAQVGGTVTAEADGLVRAEVSTGAVDELAANDQVHAVRPARPVIEHATSEGVAESGAASWHGAGEDGTGTRIAIVDGGFAGYQSLLGTELPASVGAGSFGCANSSGAGAHGTAVAEIVHDMAPGADLDLLCVEDDVDFINALDTIRGSATFDVVNASIGFPLSGRGDGEDPISRAVARLRLSGVLFVTSAGNSGNSHYHQAAVGDGTGPSLADLVDLTADEGYAFTVAPWGSATVDVQWDDWTNASKDTSTDFDVYLENQAGTIVAGSELDQLASPGAVPPVERVSITNSSSSTRTYYVLVNRYAGTGKPRLDLFLYGDLVAVETTTASSLGIPASSPAAFTIGAHCVSTGAIEPYSSRGPTIDGRVKPDISGPDGTSGSIVGNADGCASTGFFGTSASSPHVAGAAALLLGANPALDVAEVQQLLEDRAQEAGVVGKDTTYGNGRLRLGPAADTAVSLAMPFTPRDPIRLFDSRPGLVGASESPDRTTPLPSGGKVKVKVVGVAGVPADATAVVLNVTATGPTADGYLTVHPGGALPTSSNLNFKRGATVAVHVTATVGTDGRVEIFNATGSTHVVVDVSGWYGPTGAVGPATDLLHLLPTPRRAVDTRPGQTGYAEAPDRTMGVGPGATLSVRVAGGGGVPLAATAVVVNLTGVQPTTGAYLVAHPNGVPLPDSSSLNVPRGGIVANLVVVPVGADGRISIYNSSGRTNVIVDTIGWFEPGPGGAGYVALDPPTRHLDTRFGNGYWRQSPMGPGEAVEIAVARRNGVPGDAAAAMLGITAVAPSKVGYLTAFPGNQEEPDTSSLNFTAGTTTANAALAGIGSPGVVVVKVGYAAPYPNTHLISDLFGYFIDPANQPIP